MDDNNTSLDQTTRDAEEEKSFYSYIKNISDLCDEYLKTGNKDFLDKAKSLQNSMDEMFPEYKSEPEPTPPNKHPRYLNSKADNWRPF